MSVSDTTESVEKPGPPRRTAQRIAGGIALILVALVLLYSGVQALVDPATVIAGSSRSARSPDTETKAKISGLLMCFFAITVLGFGIGLSTSKKTPK